MNYQELHDGEVDACPKHRGPDSRLKLICVVAAVLGFAALATLHSLSLRTPLGLHPVELMNPVLAGTQCREWTLGTCAVLGCSSWRGETDCVNGGCLCKPGYCSNDWGVCLNPNSTGHTRNTGGTCYIFGCDSWRGPTNALITNASAKKDTKPQSVAHAFQKEPALKTLGEHAISLIAKASVEQLIAMMVCVIAHQDFVQKTTGQDTVSVLLQVMILSLHPSSQLIKKCHNSHPRTTKSPLALHSVVGVHVHLPSLLGPTEHSKIYA